MSSSFSVDQVINKKSNEPCEILFLGDTSFGENYIQRYARHGFDNFLESKGYDYPLEKISSFLLESDLVVANLETPLTNLAKSPYQGEKTYVHWSDVNHAPEALKKHNIHVLSLANNHMYDYGEEGFLQTLDVLNENGFKYFGGGLNKKNAAKPFIIEINHGDKKTMVALISCFEYRSDYKEKYQVYAGTNKSGLNKLNIDQIRSTIEQVKQKYPDIYVIVSPHWGPNYKLASTKQRRLAEKLIQSGADLIVGHGAHMLQELEENQHKWVCYSIGNFMFNSKGRYEKLNAPPYSAIAKLVIKNNDTVDIELQLYPIFTNNRINDFQVRLTTEHEYKEVTNLPYMKALERSVFKDGHLSLPIKRDN